ncbi:MAG: transglutaminase-like domain-containing protein [Chloroflexi bacterium]|nr:transglutaminase-like domain-containing protein [Chloroflexota bacterium]
MSRLHLTENGNVVPLMCEEITKERWARKQLFLPSTSHSAILYVLARTYPGCSTPMHLSVNGVETTPLVPMWPDIYQWHEISIPAQMLRAGNNLFEFWSDSHAMNSWSLALEDGHHDPQSWVSTDSGQNWRNEKMGYVNVLRGEYVVRIRLTEGEDDSAPPIVWEDPAHPRLARLRAKLPVDVFSGTILERVRDLCTWTCTRWEYSCSDPGYAPWDVETILAWGQAKLGANGLKPTVMCVHFGVTLVTACLAVGIPARCAVFTDSINGTHGHFATEIWFDDLQKWVFVDPTLDAVLFDGNIPMSVREIKQLGGGLASRVRWGLGRKFQDRNPFIADWVDRVFDPGICFKSRAIWYRTDFLSHPELTPPWHGSTAYSETGIIIEKEDLARDLGMFPLQMAAQTFDLPPQNFPGRD